MPTCQLLRVKGLHQRETAGSVTPSAWADGDRAPGSSQALGQGEQLHLCCWGLLHRADSKPLLCAQLPQV